MTASSAARWLAPGNQVRLMGPGWAGTALIAAAIAAAVTVISEPAHTALVSVARALIVGAPIAVGLYVWEQGTYRRFGLLLASVGGLSLVTTFAESSNEVAYTLGRTAGWAVEVLLVYVVLAFPTGRLPARADRLLVAAMALVVALTYLPRLFLAADFAVPSPYTSCVDACPANAAFALAKEPGFVDAVMRPAGVLLVFVVGLGVVWRMSDRLRSASPLARRMLGAVLVVGATRELALGMALVARHDDATARTVEIAAWCLALAIPVFALVFLLSLVRWRLFAERALGRLAEQLRLASDPEGIRRGFANAFGDPEIEIAFPAAGASGGWTSSRGEPIELPRAGGRREASEVRQGGVLLAAIVHDAALRDTPGLVEAGLDMAAIGLENQRLAAAATAATREVESSRARIAASADQERRRIERDLHDGAQQRLVALRIELELAEDLIRADPDGAVSRLHELEAEVDEALSELRSLGHGVYPSLLADRGLPEALGAAAARCPVRARVDTFRVGRYAPEVESAVYFCVLEALQNVVKHAGGAERVTIRVDGRGGSRLQLIVRDDGCGFTTEDSLGGAGVTNMTDRLAAVGGVLRVTSARGAGTTVRGEIPLGQPRS